MTIRSRLLFLLLPILTAFILLISFLFYFNWSQEILEGFQWRSDVSREQIDLKLNHALIIILIITITAIVSVIITVFLIADRISKPVQLLNQAALDIAAGNYETNIQVQGPKEIVELANTFNTMSDCLVDHMHRLKETSITRKQLYGEQECAQILQNYMLNKEIEAFHHSRWKLFLASTPLTNASNGLQLRTFFEKEGSISVTLTESIHSGFESLFQLNRTYFLPPEELKQHPYIYCDFSLDGSIIYTCQKMPIPLVWNYKKAQWQEHSIAKTYLEQHDLLFFYNSALFNHLGSEEEIKVWIGRVLRHFAGDGIENVQTILNNELHFLKKRENLKETVIILTFMRV